MKESIEITTSQPEFNCKNLKISAFIWHLIHH